MRVLSALFMFFAATALAGAGNSAPPSAGVAVVWSAEWNLGDSARDGAGEFAVFLRVAQLQYAHRAAGLVAVGDRHGMLRSGGERALRHVVFTGIAVVKLAPGGEVASSDADVFLRGGTLTPQAATAVLTRCLAQHGSPPAAANPEAPTAAELEAIRAHLHPFQSALARAAAEHVAQR